MLNLLYAKGLSYRNKKQEFFLSDILNFSQSTQRAQRKKYKKVNHVVPQRIDSDGQSAAA
ncbi:MAG: hypothetical protein BWK80_25065 [Desulfobacteraceae bacterium IS3]|nr:MAG: hypothetical protein BWK80_25065 [Desulfobacteraceae bacterium IS3]